MPLKMAKSLSLPIARQPHQGVRLSPAETSIQLIKSFMALLLEPEASRPQVPAAVADGSALQDKIEEKAISRSPALRQMPQVWGLVLESFTTVSVSKLVEARIIDSLLRAFLRASREIQQSTFPQILAISETIAKDKVHSRDAGRLLSSLVFTTLSTTVGNPVLESIGYSVCQGWLDIMICGSVSRPPLPAAPPGETVLEPVHSRMDAVEVSSLLRKATKFMRTHLNLGSFEGTTGAQKAVVMRLGLATDLLLVAL